MEFKDKDQLVQEVIDSLQSTLPENTDFSDGEPLKTIIEAIMAELDFQYWQLEQVYDNSFIDTAYGDDLDSLVALLGVTRVQPAYAIGTVTFSRSTPAPQDLSIPTGTLVETLQDVNGVSIQFETKTDAILLSGTTSIDVEIQAVEAGNNGNVAANNIIIINNPPYGVESVNNALPTSGGGDIETDDALKDRTKHVLDSSGLGTVNALEFNIKEISGIKSVSVNNMARGIGTVDILVLGETVPLSDTKKDEILDCIDNTKSAGIDVQLLEPTVIYQDVTVSLVLEDGYTIDDIGTSAQDAIENYINNLGIGELLITNQLIKVILESNTFIVDLTLTAPTSNVSITSDEIIRVGTITIQ